MFFGILPFMEEKSKDLTEVNLSIIEKDISSFAKDVKIGGLTEAVSQLARRCADKSYIDPQWGILAGRVYMLLIRLDAPKTFSDATIKMKDNLASEYFDFVAANADALNAMIKSERDETFDLFAIVTLTRSYLGHLKVDGKTMICETPQYLYLRVATYLHYPDLDKIRMVYENLSQGNYSQATPTMFNSGMKIPQLSSCFLMTVDDNMTSIQKSWGDISTISANAGAVGISYSKVRHSEIGQRGYSNGVIPWLTINNKILKAVNQSGRRPGNGTMYLRDCHIDIHEFVELRDEGPEDLRTRDLFLGVMISDLFMKRVEADESWSVFCPNKSDGLMEMHSEKFEEKYLELERQGRYSRQFKARDLWLHILSMQIKTGMPFILFIDACNKKSNHQHMGTITGSNLCTEILEYTSKDEIASCVLGSISINKCVTSSKSPPPRGRVYYYHREHGEGPTKFFSFSLLEKYVAEMVENLEAVIDRNYYPSATPQIEYANKKNRPLGIGVQGFADALAMLDICWTTEDGKLTPEAKYLNQNIFECMYFAAMKKSMELAKQKGPYESFPGSPLSQGKFQFDLAGKGSFLEDDHAIRSKQEWDQLRQDVMKYGARHSLLIALMPTASSANILGNAECFEPFNALMYSRTVLGGQFIVINKHLVRDLKHLEGSPTIGGSPNVGPTIVGPPNVGDPPTNVGWSTETVRSMIENKGSIQNLQIAGLSPKGVQRLEYLKLKYRTVTELSQCVTLDLAIDRSIFVCQTASQNCFMKNPTRTKLNAYLFYAWKGGLKTGMYYLRQTASVDPINMSIDSLMIPQTENKISPINLIKIKEPRIICEGSDECLVCQT